MSAVSLPILYSFRRCPYAIRARMALKVSGVEVKLREILLGDKPSVLLQLSPKGTVPVLHIRAPQERVIDESLQIAAWALAHHDPHNWLYHDTSHALIAQADNEFKPLLDRYKYADRYPDLTEQAAFAQAQGFLQTLESALVGDIFLINPQASLLDVMIFPFIRQFAFVNKARFDALNLPKLHAWLEYWLNNPLFISIMHKQPVWSGDEAANEPML